MHSVLPSPRRSIAGLMAAATLAASLGAWAAGELDVRAGPGAGVEAGRADAAAPLALSLNKIGGYTGGGGGAAEITAYDADSRRLFVVNGAMASVDVVDIADPTLPVLLRSIDVKAYGGSVNSVAAKRGLVAIAVEASPKTDLGSVLLLDANTLDVVEVIPVGAQPDMLTFTPDGRHLVVANEGEPSSYGQADSVDPEGSISIVRVKRNGKSNVETVDFRAFIGREDELRAQGIRLFGPGANAAQDLEPEYVAISPDGKTAYVTLQENNAIAVVDILQASLRSIGALGTKDHNVDGFGLDASDEDGGVDTNTGTPTVAIVPRPVRGLYMPDGIASFRTGGKTYLITANEGDAREWTGFAEEVRVRAHCTAGLDPAVFGVDAARLLFDSALGRLRVTSAPNGGVTGKNAAGECTELYSFGARSVSIWTSGLERVWDSGDALERLTTSLPNVAFNASHDNNNLDGRSPAKGPEPEAVVVHRINGRQIAFVALERVGGIVVYDVTRPAAPSLVTYVNTREGTTGDLGPEGVLLIDAADSPNGKPLLVVSHEVSGTVAIFEIVVGTAGAGR